MSLTQALGNDYVWHLGWFSKDDSQILVFIRFSTFIVPLYVYSIYTTPHHSAAAA
jgi:hypothetical protein